MASPKNVTVLVVFSNGQLLAMMLFFFVGIKNDVLFSPSGLQL
jgi:hypothetical protein